MHIDTPLARDVNIFLTMNESQKIKWPHGLCNVSNIKDLGLTNSVT